MLVKIPGIIFAWLERSKSVPGLMVVKCLSTAGTPHSSLLQCRRSRAGPIPRKCDNYRHYPETESAVLGVRVIQRVRRNRNAATG